jgi:rRNA maturation endonuclease Nob1|tara:strand:+ start:377 stop:526 length:150 start_codon:yes stop_codon:yes gene_type:complete
MGEKCPKCEKVYDDDVFFCSKCGCKTRTTILMVRGSQAHKEYEKRRNQG